MPPTGPYAAEIEQHVIDPCLASAVTEERFDSLSVERLGRQRLVDMVKDMDADGYLARFAAQLEPSLAGRPLAERMSRYRNASEMCAIESRARLN